MVLGDSFAGDRFLGKNRGEESIGNFASLAVNVFHLPADHAPPNLGHRERFFSIFIRACGGSFGGLGGIVWKQLQKQIGKRVVVLRKAPRMFESSNGISEHQTPMCGAPNTFVDILEHAVHKTRSLDRSSDGRRMSRNRPTERRKFRASGFFGAPSGEKSVPGVRIEKNRHGCRGILEVFEGEAFEDDSCRNSAKPFAPTGGSRFVRGGETVMSFFERRVAELDPSPGAGHDIPGADRIFQANSSNLYGILGCHAKARPMRFDPARVPDELRRSAIFGEQ